MLHAKVKMFLTRLVFIGVLAFSIDFARTQEIRKISKEIQEKIDDFIEDIFLPSSGVSGLGLAIVQNDEDGEILYTTGYGNADHAKGIPNGNQTQFLLGSVTKTFTSLVVLKALYENFPELGEAVLDTPIRQLIPEANFTLKDRFRSEYATFRDLLTHRMCIPRSDFQLMAEPFPTTKEILYRQRFAEEWCGFRTKFMYNNHMVLYAADLVGQLEKQTFEQMAGDLLKKIGMVESTLVRNTDENFPKEQSRAKPYYIKDHTATEMNPELIKRLAVVQPIGGLYVTPNDMARFLKFQVDKGAIDGVQVIPEQVMNWVTKPQGVNIFPKINYKTKPDDIFEMPLAYGLGVTIGSYNSWQRISHNGYFTPYRSEISWYPAKNLGIFTSTHESPSRVKQHVLHAFILETLLGYDNAADRALKLLEGQTEKWERERLEKSKAFETFLGHCKNMKAQHGSYNASTSWPKLMGIYGSSVSGDVTITVKYNPQRQRPELYLSYGKWAKGWMEYLGDEAYQISWDTDLAQDYYAAGDEDGLGYAYLRQEEGLLEFVRPSHFGMITYAQFKKGETMEQLKPVTWKDETC